MSNLKDRPRTELELITTAMRHNAIQNALNNVSDDVMTAEEYEKEYKKAEYIMKDAMCKIMAECNLYGDDSIICENNINLENKKTVSDFFIMLVSNVSEEIDKEINGPIVIPAVCNIPTKPFILRTLR